MSTGAAASGIAVRFVLWPGSSTHLGTFGTKLRDD